jgi:GNAT superfamily N-acetyltransferase
MKGVHFELLFQKSSFRTTCMAQYPRELEKQVTLKDDSRLLVRPIRPGDETLMHELLYSFSKETIYHRFFALISDMSLEQLKYYVNVDYEERMAIVSVIEVEDREKIIGVARYDLDRLTNMAEVAVVVEDEWQNKGLGSYLLEYLAQIAKSRGISGFTAEVMPDNFRMLHLLNKTSRTIKKTFIDGTIRVALKFTNEATN